MIEASIGVANPLGRSRWQKETVPRVVILAAVVLSLALPAAAQERVRIVNFNGGWIPATAAESEMDRWESDVALREHHERIAGVIEALDPDIVNLVEVTSRAAVDRIVEILHAKGMTAFKAYHLDLHDTYTGQDVALISKKDPLSVEGQQIRTIYSEPPDSTWRLPYTWRDEDGQVRSRTTSISKNVLYYFEFGDVRVGFLGLHLIANPSHPRRNAQRTAQATIAQKILRDEIVARGFLPVVVGDINDFDTEVPDRSSSVSQTSVLSLLKDYQPHNPGPEMFNAAELIHRQHDRYTTHWDKDHDDWVDPEEPFTMLDHVLIHRDLRRFVSRVFIDHGHGAVLSDHWPMVVDLEFPQ